MGLSVRRGSVELLVRLHPGPAQPTTAAAAAAGEQQQPDAAPQQGPADEASLLGLPVDEWATALLGPDWRSMDLPDGFSIQMQVGHGAGGPGGDSPCWPSHDMWRDL